MKRKIEVGKGADAKAVRESLKDIKGVEVKEDAGGVTVEHGDEVDGVQVDRALHAHARRSLVARVRAAKTVVEVRDAVADALEALAGG